VIAGLAILGSLLADGLIFATLAELIAAAYDGSSPHAVGAWAFCIVALAGYGLPRLVEGFDIGPRKGYALTAGAGLALIYLLVRITVVGDVAIWDFSWIGDFMRDAQSTTEAGGHALTGAILLLGAWARTSLRSSEDIEMEMIPRSFALPFAFVTVFIVLGAVGDRSGEVGRAGAAFYTMAILSLAFSQLAMSGATFGEVKAGGTAGILLAGTAGIAVVGLVIIGLLTAVFGPVIGPVISKAVEVTLTIILTPFAWLLTRLFEALFAGASPFPELTETVARTSEDAGNPDNAERSAAGQAGLFLMRTLFLLLFFGLVTLLAAVFIRLRNRRTHRLADGRETAAAGNFREDLGSLFRSLLRRKPHVEPGFASTEATRLYLEVLAKAESAGHSRPDGETAREFAPELQETFANPVTDDITRAFEAARYGGREPDPRTLEDLRRRWQNEAN